MENETSWIPIEEGLCKIGWVEMTGNNGAVPEIDDRLLDAASRVEFDALLGPALHEWSLVENDSRAPILVDVR